MSPILVPFDIVNLRRLQNGKRAHVLVFLINLEIKAHQILFVRKHVSVRDPTIERLVSPGTNHKRKTQCHTYDVHRSLDILPTPPCLCDS